MKITPVIFIFSLLVGLLISIGLWTWTVTNTFIISDPMWQSLPSLLIHTFEYQKLRPIAFLSLSKGVLPVLALLYFLNEIDGAERRTKFLRGARVVSADDLAQTTKAKADQGQIVIAGIPMPEACEPNHVLFAGSTNTGKTVANDGFLQSALTRRDRVIVIDPDGHAFARFARKGDTILNPFDKRSPGWSIFNEFRKPYDFDRFAKSVIPDSSDAVSQQWHGYAQQLFTETARALTQTGETSTDRLVYWLTQAPVTELKGLLAGTAASAQFEPGAEKAFASTRFILSYHIGAFQYLKPGEFSLRTWLESGNGNLYITWREDMLTALRPLLSAWADILIASILTLPDEAPRTLWMMLDELASLERLSSLEAGLSKGRKHGLRIVAGLQSLSQLDALYGVHHAKSLRSNFRNLLVLGCSNSDPETAEAISKGLGDSEIERVVTTHTKTKDTTSTSTSKQILLERAVLPVQLTSLNPLHGYLKFAGDYPIGKIRLVHKDYPVRVKAFLERE